MGRRVYKPGCLVEARNTKYARGKGIILTGPHDEKPWYSADHTIENFLVHWFERPEIIERWEWGRTGTRNFKMTKNQIKAVRQKKS
jgi:hypothetical protein